MGLRQAAPYRWLTGLAERVYPDLDEALWNRTRDREMRLMLRDIWADQPSGDGPQQTSTPHLVVVPMDGPERGTFGPAQGNFFYEIAQAAREHFGPDCVSVFFVGADEPASEWHPRLEAYLRDVGATHLVAQVEKDPAGHQEWTWDVLWSHLVEQWGGVFLGVMFDSGFRWLTIPVRRMARMSDRFLLVDICMPMDGVLVKGRPEVGPVNMPVSTETLDIIDAAVGGRPKVHDVTFIGALYPYRTAMIKDLEAAGLRVSVNPHRMDAAHDLDSSRANQPTYVDYMAALADSHITINFSQSSAGPFQQLKTRILEATSMGCLVLTDDVDRTGRFWREGEEYSHFSVPEEVPAIAQAWLADRVRLEQAQIRAKARARSINTSSFWGGVEAGLRARGLPPLRDEVDLG